MFLFLKYFLTIFGLTFSWCFKDVAPFFLADTVSGEQSAANVVFVPLCVMCLFSYHCFQDLSFAFLAVCFSSF